MKIVVFNLYIFHMNFSMIILLLMLLLLLLLCHRLPAAFSQHSMLGAQYEKNEKSSGAAQRSEQFYFFSEYYLIVVAVASLDISTTIVGHFCAHSLGACVHGEIWRCALFASYKVEYYYLIKIQLQTNNNNVQHFKHSLPCVRVYQIIDFIGNRFE